MVPHRHTLQLHWAHYHNPNYRHPPHIVELSDDIPACEHAAHLAAKDLHREVMRNLRHDRSRDLERIFDAHIDCLLYTSDAADE